MARAKRNSVMTRGTMAIAGGASTLTATGGVAAQLAGGAGPLPSLLLFSISGALALLTVLTKLYEIHCDRTPEYIAATALARAARRHSDPDRSIRLALVDRALARNAKLSADQLATLLANEQQAPTQPPGEHPAAS